MLVKCMPKEGKTKTWLTESSHVLMLLHESTKWLMAGYKYPRSPGKINGDSHFINSETE